MVNMTKHKDTPCTPPPRIRNILRRVGGRGRIAPEHNTTWSQRMLEEVGSKIFVYGEECLAFGRREN